MFLITRGVYLALQEAARRMSDGGRIVSVSTGGTVGSSPGGGAYTGSKAAVEQFTIALAKELGPRSITVNTVLPGLTRTEGLVLPEPMVEQIVAETPLGGLGEPRDVADAVAFLVSDNARWVTGHHLRVAGGLVRAGCLASPRVGTAGRARLGPPSRSDPCSAGRARWCAAR